jgi:hypothetical protein
MGFMFTPIAFMPNTPAKSGDVNANFAAIQNSSTFWGEWYYDQGDSTHSTVRSMTLEDYTTQDPQFAPNGLRFIRLRPSFDSTNDNMSLCFSAVRSSTGDIWDALFLDVATATYPRFGIKHGPSGKTYPTSAVFIGVGAGTFTFFLDVTPVRAKATYGTTDATTATAQTIGYSALGSGTINIAVSSSSVGWTCCVFSV